MTDREDVVADITKLSKAVIELTVAVAKIKQSTDVDIRVLNDAVADLNDKMEQSGDDPKYRKGHADGVQELIDHVNHFGQ